METLSNQIPLEQRGDHNAKLDPPNKTHHANKQDKTWTKASAISHKSTPIHDAIHFRFYC